MKNLITTATRITLNVVAATFAIFAISSCCGKEKLADKQDYYDNALAQIIKEANIPLIQVKYVTPTDSIYCQVGQTPWCSATYKGASAQPISDNDMPAADSVAVPESCCDTCYTNCSCSEGCSDKQAIFQAASLSKVVFAYVVLRMYDRGEIDLDKPLYEYTDIDRFVDKDEAKKLTARLILSHRSGIDDWADSPSSDTWPTSPINFTFPVDSIFGYSGEGFAFLQRAVEKIKGKSIQEIAEEEVFKPFNMPLSSYDWKPEFEGITTASTRRDGTSTGVRQFPRQNVAYTLRTCAKDYSNFLRVILKGEGLKPETYKQFITPCSGPATQFPPKVRKVDEKKSIFWGLGIGIEENPRHGRVLWHWGDNGNTKALFLIIPDEGKTLVYFANSGAGHDIIDKVTNLFLEDPEPFDVTEWINEY